MRKTTRMGRPTISALIVIALALVARPASTHHSISALFELSTLHTLTGTLTRVDLRNPHTELSMDVMNDRGEVETWVIQAASLRWFVRNDASKSDFEHAIGQSVTMDVFRARDGNLWGALVKITFPDGRVLDSNPTQ